MAADAAIKWSALRMKLQRLTRCPLPFAAPFMPPWRRPLTATARHRLIGWCEELLPGVVVDIVEWVSADTRQPLHVMVLSFPGSHRPPVVLHLKVEDVDRHHLVQAFGSGEAP